MTEAIHHNIQSVIITLDSSHNHLLKHRNNKRIMFGSDEFTQQLSEGHNRRKRTCSEHPLKGLQSSFNVKILEVCIVCFGCMAVFWRGFGMNVSYKIILKQSKRRSKRRTFKSKAIQKSKEVGFRSTCLNLQHPFEKFQRRIVNGSEDRF